MCWSPQSLAEPHNPLYGKQRPDINYIPHQGIIHGFDVVKIQKRGKLSAKHMAVALGYIPQPPKCLVELLGLVCVFKIPVIIGSLTNTVHKPKTVLDVLYGATAGPQGTKKIRPGTARIFLDKLLYSLQPVRMQNMLFSSSIGSAIKLVQRGGKKLLFRSCSSSVVVYGLLSLFDNLRIASFSKPVRTFIDKVVKTL